MLFKMPTDAYQDGRGLFWIIPFTWEWKMISSSLHYPAMLLKGVTEKPCTQRVSVSKGYLILLVSRQLSITIVIHRALVC